VTKVDEVLRVGDTVEVKILKLSGEGKRISLSIRQALEDPWSQVEERFVVGQVYPGTVQRLTDFGAFVELSPGLEALAPASEFPPSKSGWRNGLESGQTRDWLVMAVDAAKHRVSLTPPADGTAPVEQPKIEVGAVVKGKVQRVERFGVFLWLGPGRVGLMPSAFSGTPRGEDLARRFPIADEIEAVVTELADDGRRIRLARKGVEIQERPTRSPRSRPRDERRRGPASRPAEVASGGEFGTLLADKLRAALGGKSDTPGT
jgi:small subunit ribosomal protein S1